MCKCIEHPDMTDWDNPRASTVKLEMPTSIPPDMRRKKSNLKLEMAKLQKKFPEMIIFALPKGRTVEELVEDLRR